MNIKRKYKITAMLLAFILIFSATLALFADRASTEAEGTVGSVQLSDIDLSGKLLDEDGKNILNPGDMRDLSFTVTNEGNMSVDVRETIVLRAFDEEGNPISFSNGNQAEFEIYHRNDVVANQYGSYSPKPGAQPLSSKLLQGNKITYSPVRYILNGNESENPREIETGIISDSKTNDYVLVYKGETDNNWQGSQLYVSALVEAIQHRNTDDENNKWQTISTKTITFGAENVLVVPQHIRNYHITYNLNGGTVEQENPTSYNVESGFIELNNPTKDNAYFLGWIWRGQSVPERNVSFNAETYSGDIEFTAVYAPCYTLTTGANVKTALGTSTTKVIFGTKSDYPDVVSGTPTHIGATSADEIDMYSVGTVRYILSDGVIVFNSASNTMFQALSNLKSIEFNNIDTSKATTINNMFGRCSQLTSVDVSSFDTSSVTNMGGLFYGCSKLSSADLRSFDTSQVTVMGSLFNGCSSLTSVNLSSFDTSKATSLLYMFCNCTNLKSVNITNFDTTNVTNMTYMFQYCRQLSELDLSSFNTSKVTTTQHMFEDCSGLKKVYVSTMWNMDKVSSSGSYLMFYGNSLLVGGAGTAYNDSYKDKTYARVDDPSNGKPGYFTLKQ